MAKVAAFLRVLPVDVDVDVEGLKEKIKESLTALGKEFNIHSYKVEPIAFGLKALKLTVVMPEETEGGTYIVEEAVKRVEGVGEVEVEFVTRLS
ncbi:MAG: elongation factor 1-beta [Candidatus Nezhaarchaeota archaeon]|nr:elongation factor 1-beta [Candidatus Nezhaarchaeota archaeon]